jgi:hypothetical protein
LDRDDTGKVEHRGVVSAMSSVPEAGVYQEENRHNIGEIRLSAYRQHGKFTCRNGP